MTHLLILTPGFPAEISDSQCIPALQIFVKNLNKLKEYNISIITFYYPSLVEEYDWNGIKVYPQNGQPGLLQKPFLMYKVFNEFKKIHKKTPVNIIHSFWLQDTTWIGRKISQIFNIPHLSTAMGQDVRKHNKYLNWLPLESMDIIVLSHFHQDSLYLSKGIKQFPIIPWGIDPVSFPAISTHRDIDLIGIGNLTPLKNYAVFIEVVSILIKKFPDLKAVLIGNGIEYDKLRKLIKEKYIGNHITLTGAIPREHVLRYLSRSKVLFHPSTFESFGLVFAEAQQMGVKIISRKVGIAEESEHWSIYNSHEEMINMTTNMLLNSSPNTTINKYHIKNTVQAYKKTYEQMMLRK